MGYDTTCRCALWVSPRVFVAAEELADLIGLDVDTFIACVVLELRDKEIAEGWPARSNRSSQEILDGPPHVKARSEQAAAPVRMTMLAWPMLTAELCELSGRTLLVVEDDDDVVDMLATVLGRYGVHIVRARTVADAVAYVDIAPNRFAQLPGTP